MNNINFDLQVELVKSWKKYETINGSLVKREPIKYEVPSIAGIHFKTVGKDINEVQLNTLEYILYYLHNVDCNLIEETAMALFYYMIHRLRKMHLFEKELIKLVNHYSIQNKQKQLHFTSEPCVYLLEITIGSKKIYKIGKTTNMESRCNNLISDIKRNYRLVSVSVNIIKQYITNDIDELESKILSRIKTQIKPTKFYFEGHTESFESETVLKIFEDHTKLSNW